MRHYEVVLLIHPDYSDKATSISERYTSIIKKHDGLIHRFEDWGRRPLAYQIKKQSKAHYILMNIECNNEALKELNHNMKYNEQIIRSLVIKKDNADTTASPFVRKDKEGKEE